jgi:hypothetical protein
MDRPSLVEAFNGVKDRYGDIDVLEYSPASHSPVLTSPWPTLSG